MKAVFLWSGPRNVSTALMYSFAQRSDTRVLDEPLYGHYLRASGAVHPGGDEIVENMNCDGDAVMREILAPGFCDKDVLFVKHMAHHLIDIDLWFLPHTQNTFLIRDPREMLPSLTVQVPHAKLADTGLRRQWELFQDLQESGLSPAVIDSRELLLNPGRIVEEFCKHLGLAFDPRMLRWPAGPKAEDGIWSKHWYHSVHQSTGFASYTAKPEFPEELTPLLEECQPYYKQLFAHAVKAGPARETDS